MWQPRPKVTWDNSDSKLLQRCRGKAAFILCNNIQNEFLRNRTPLIEVFQLSLPAFRNVVICFCFCGRRCNRFSSSRTVRISWSKQWTEFKSCFERTNEEIWSILYCADPLLCNDLGTSNETTPTARQQILNHPLLSNAFAIKHVPTDTIRVK
jgi:hypothetical protein